MTEVRGGSMRLAAELGARLARECPLGKLLSAIAKTDVVPPRPGYRGRPCPRTSMAGCIFPYCQCDDPEEGLR